MRRGLSTLANAGTVVCRCEAVTRRDVDDFLNRSPFVTGINATKLSCRTGMGPCQGRYCESTIGALIAAKRGTPIDVAGRFSAHLPIKPVPVADLAGLDGPAE